MSTEPAKEVDHNDIEVLDNKEEDQYYDDEYDNEEDESPGKAPNSKDIQPPQEQSNVKPEESKQKLISEKSGEPKKTPVITESRAEKP